MGQLGFFDLIRRYESLDEKSDPLVAIAAMVPQDAGLQEPGFSPEISLNSRAAYNNFNVQRHLISARTHRVFALGDEHVARRSRGRLKIFETQNSRVLLSTT
jgi:hypothetical protein